jgi:hypothetical protein
MSEANAYVFQSPYPLSATLKLLHYSCIPIYLAGGYEVIKMDASTCRFKWCHKRGLFREICDLITISRYGTITDGKTLIQGRGFDFSMELVLEPSVGPNGSVVVNARTVCKGDMDKCSLFSKEYIAALSQFTNSLPGIIAPEIFKFRVKEAPGPLGTMETPEKTIDEELLRRGLTSAYMALSVEGVAYILRKSPETRTIVLRAGWRVGDLLEYIRGEARKYREYQLILVKLRIPLRLDVWIVVDTSGDVIAWRGLVGDKDYGASWPDELYKLLEEFEGDDVEVTVFVAPWKSAK